MALVVTYGARNGGVHREGTAFCSLGGAISGGSKFFFEPSIFIIFMILLFYIFILSMLLVF